MYTIHTIRKPIKYFSKLKSKPNLRTIVAEGKKFPYQFQKHLMKHSTPLI